MSTTLQAIELLQQKAAKEDELKEIDSKLQELGITFAGSGAPVKAAPNVTVGKATDPKTDGKAEGKAEGKSKPSAPRAPRKAAATSDDKRGRGRPSKAESGVDKQPPLEELLLELVEKAKHGLSLAEMVELALKAGYVSTSKNFHNMVQQAVGRMMKKKVLVRDNDSMRYFKKEAA